MSDIAGRGVFTIGDLFGGSGSVNDQLRVISAAPGMASFTLAAADITTETAFPSAAADWMEVESQGLWALEFRLGGTGIFHAIPRGGLVTIHGITNTNQVSVRRAYTAPPDGNTQTDIRVHATSYVGGCKWQGCKIVGRDSSMNGVSYVAITTSSVPCQAVLLTNDFGVNVVYRLGSGTAGPNWLLPPGSTKLIHTTNANLVFLNLEENASAGGTRALKIRAQALMLRSGATITSDDEKMMALSRPSRYIPEEAYTDMGQVADDSLVSKIPNTMSHRLPFQPHTKPGLRRLAQFRDITLITSSADAPVATATTPEESFGHDNVARVTMSGANRTYAITTTPTGPAVNLTAGDIHLHLAIVSETPVSSVNVQLFSSGSPTAVPANYHQGIDPNFLAAMFNSRQRRSMACVGIPRTFFTAVGSGANMSAITWARLVLTGTGTVIDLGAIDYVPDITTKGLIVFTFDDLIGNVWNNAVDLFARYNARGVFMCDSARRIGDKYPSLLSAAHLRRAQDLGWQIAYQTYAGNDDYPTESDGYSTMQMKSRSFMLAAANGFYGGPDFSYHTNFVESTSFVGKKILKRMARTVRTFVQFGASTSGEGAGGYGLGAVFPFDDPWCVRGIELSSCTEAQMLSQIHRARDINGIQVFAAHNDLQGTVRNYVITMLEEVAANPNDYAIVTLDEVAAINYAAQAKANGLL